jgi:hypothetical protein
MKVGGQRFCDEAIAHHAQSRPNPRGGPPAHRPLF